MERIERTYMHSYGTISIEVNKVGENWTFTTKCSESELGPLMLGEFEFVMADCKVEDVEFIYVGADYIMCVIGNCMYRLREDCYSPQKYDVVTDAGIFNGSLAIIKDDVLYQVDHNTGNLTVFNQENIFIDKLLTYRTYDQKHVVLASYDNNQKIAQFRTGFFDIAEIVIGNHSKFAPIESLYPIAQVIIDEDKCLICRFFNVIVNDNGMAEIIERGVHHIMDDCDVDIMMIDAKWDKDKSESLSVVQDDKWYIFGGTTGSLGKLCFVVKLPSEDREIVYKLFV